MLNMVKFKYSSSTRPCGQLLRYLRHGYGHSYFSVVTVQRKLCLNVPISQATLMDKFVRELYVVIGYLDDDTLTF